MEEISTRTLLARGATYIGNHPDHLAKRIALAQVLVDARLVRSIEAGILVFRIWAAKPAGATVELHTIFNLAHEKVASG